MTLFLGLNAHHGDAAACLIDDRGVVAAAEEERFRRVKHWQGFPEQAVAFCLAEAGVSLDDVAHVAVNRDPSASWLRRMAFVARRRPSLSKLRDRLVTRWRARGLMGELQRLHGRPVRATLHEVEHHRAHLASAALASPFDRCVALSVDQFGDFASCAWGEARGGQLRVDDRVHFPHSLGTFYSAITQFLGFPAFGDEYKVMGLAPYGRPTFLPEMRKVARSQAGGGFRLDLRYFRHDRERVEFIAPDGSPRIGDLFSPELEVLLGPRRLPDAQVDDRTRDLAASAQARYEEVFLELLRELNRRYGHANLALAGGCAQNSVANGKITAQTPFERVYVAAASGDAGGALGAALAVRSQVTPHASPIHLTHAYHGPGVDPAEVEALFAAHAAQFASAGCATTLFSSEVDLCRHVAGAIARGKVVGWFQGRMEWGPRALGNRSILADPRRPDIRDLLNAKIKRRESFRPFAPVVVREALGEWFEADDDLPFMSCVVPVRQERRAAIPAVTHVDGSARVQTVRREDNSRFHALLGAFGEQTGVPMLLNTSFNENEPIVCRPQEALACFLRTKMDLLVIGDHLVERSEVRSSASTVTASATTAG